jgi:two-component system KDP operon response regulator KdpE
MSEAGGALLLLIEDDVPTRRALVANLSGHGHQVDEAGTAAEGLRAWEDRRPDLILLDLGLPDRDGLTSSASVRREAATPILVLSAAIARRDKVTALEQGADDYLTKPFGMAELRARIGAMLRRAAGGQAGRRRRASCGPASRLTLDSHTVRGPRRRAARPSSRPREYELLQGPRRARAGSVVTRGRLLRAVWGAAYRTRRTTSTCTSARCGASSAAATAAGRPDRGRAGRGLPGACCLRPPPSRAFRRIEEFLSAC